MYNLKFVYLLTTQLYTWQSVSKTIPSNSKMIWTSFKNRRNYGIWNLTQLSVLLCMISGSKPPINSQYTMHGQTLDTVDTARYLGVDISSNLIFNQHISRISSDANKTLAFLKRNLRTKNPDVREAAYKSLIRPQVEYASTVCSPYTKKGIKKTEMVQSRSIRWTMNNYSTYDSVTDMKTQLCWRSLEQRRADARLMMLYKIIHGLVAIPLPPYFRQPLRMTRHSHPLVLTQIHTSCNYYKYSLFPLSVVQWNRLPVGVVVLPTLINLEWQSGLLTTSCPNLQRTHCF